MHQETEITRSIRNAYEGVIQIYTSPLPNVAPIEVRVPAGRKIADYLPHGRAPWVCIANGVPLKQDYWRARTVYAGDAITLHPVVLGRNSMSILAMVAIIVIAIFAPYLAAGIMGTTVGAMGAAGAMLSAGIVMVGTALVNAVITPKDPKQESATVSNTYNVALSANQARLNQPIPVGYGRVRSFPDYAAQPYSEYSTTTSEDGDQYFYALYAIGQGDYSITAVMLADTDINAFTDVEYKILPPGVAPTIVNPRVVTALEVGGQILSKTPVGPFVCCGPTRRAESLGIDLVFARGLTDIHIPTGKAGPISVTVFVDIAEVNDAFKKKGDWVRLATEKITGSSATPQRRSFKYKLPKVGRYAVRLSRSNDQSRNVDHYDECTWAAMRGYLADDAPLAPNTTHLELRMKATEQLSGASQRKIGVLWQRLLRTWSPDTGMSAELEATRNPMWALLDKWTNEIYGDRLPLDRIDMQSVYDLAMLADVRKDRFDFIFDSKTTSYEADQLIARVLRSTPVRRNGVRSVVRDSLDDLPVTAYTSRTILKDSVSMQYMQVTEETADGVIAEYFDRNAFDWIEVECPAPGRTYTHPGHPNFNPDLPSMENPVRLQLPGITGPTHAEREGLYHAAANVLRRKYCTWQTEMQGALAWYGAPVLFAPLLHNSAQSGDCAFYDPETRALSLTEQPQLTATSSIVLMRPNGTVTDAIPVLPGPDEYSVILASDPGFSLVLSDSRKERTKFVLLQAVEHRTMCKVLALRPRGKNSDGAPIYELFAVVEDDDVHRVDNHLLPAPGDDPDAPEPWDIGDGTIDGPVVIPPEPELPPGNPYEILSINVNSEADRPFFTLANNGELLKHYRVLQGRVVEAIQGYWFRQSPQPNIGWEWEFQISRPLAWTGDDGGYSFMWVKNLEYQAMGQNVESEWMRITADFKLEMDDQTDYFDGTIKFRTSSGVVQSTHRLLMEARKGT